MGRGKSLYRMGGPAGHRHVRIKSILCHLRDGAAFASVFAGNARVWNYFPAKGVGVD
jgi:hypothetical protein